MKGEQLVLERLDKILRSKEIHITILPVIERVRAELAHKEHDLMTWEPIPLTTYGDALPPQIRSSWVFVLRAGADTGAERHPNSHQRMMTWEGSGDMRVARAWTLGNVNLKKISEGQVKGAESRMRWRSNILVSDLNAPLSRRWISIPPNVWHRPVVRHGANWVVVSFHTVPAEELIEERLDSDAASGTKQMRYLDQF